MNNEAVEILQIISERLIDFNPEKVIILYDENTYKYCYPIVKDCFKGLLNTDLLVIKSGENFKNIDQVIEIWKKFSNSLVTKKSLVINIGGGVLCDIGSFAASCYYRGIDFVNMPTTLLSMVDASIGGKNGINFENVKNQIGVFKKPKTVFIYPDFLKTLPQIHLKSGFAEMIKHSLLANDDYFNFFSDKTIEDVLNDSRLIYASAKIKLAVVKNDFEENNLRKSLNLGHTVAHAIESFYLNNNKVISHGEAVAIGLIIELYISTQILGFPEIKYKKMCNQISKCFDYVNFDDSDVLNICDYMKFDKKNQKESEVTFSLLKDIGEFETNSSVSKDLLISAFKYYKEVYNK